MKTRNNHLDFITAIFIVWMIFGHFSTITKYEIPYYNILNYCFFYFMPWFFFKSGMFHKNISINETIKKGAKRFLVPFICFSIIGWTLDSIIIIIEGKASFFSLFIKPFAQIVYLGSSGGNWPLWFLLSLYFVKILASLVHYSKSKIVYAICAIITITIPFLMNYFKIEKFIWIANTLNGFLFYWLGYKFKEKQFSNVYFIFSVFLFIIITIFIPSFADIHKNTLFQGNYYIWLLYCGCGIISINNIAKRLNISNLFIERIGKDSMTYYVTHWLFLSIAHILVVNILHNHNHSIYFWATTILFITLSPLINKYLKGSKYNYIIGL